jgi:hypothetical protein
LRIEDDDENKQKSSAQVRGRIADGQSASRLNVEGLARLSQIHN